MPDLPEGISTLPHVRTQREVRRARNLRRAGVGLLLAFVLAGLLGVWGCR